MSSEASTAQEALHKFLLIYRHLRQVARNVDEKGVRGRQLAVMQFLQEQGSATVSEIQNYMYISASSASTMISNLEDTGYVERTRSTDDNRVVLVELTPMGKEIAQSAAIDGIGLLRRRLPTLSEDRLQKINDALADIMTLMEVTEEE
ncbi:MAG: MarR family transcriptional regulator [Anaerolineae bacterium]|nr:MarR family transcriptional regulator [Anaerolineae bacterium]